MKITVATPILLLILLVLTTSGVQCVNWVNANPYGPPQATLITIQADGTVAPAGSPLKSVGKGLYVLTEDLSTSQVSMFERYTNKIRVEKDNIVIDGANHTVDGGGERVTAIEIDYRNNVTVRNIVLSHYDGGILVWCSSNINITGNLILSGKTGVTVSNSSNVIIAQNIFADNSEQTTIRMEDSSMTIVYGNELSCRPIEGWLINGFRMEYCQNNIVAANTIAGFYCGIGILNSSNNQFYQNNLVDNNIQALDFLRDELFQKNNQTNYVINQNMLQQNHTTNLFPVWDYSTNLWQNNYWSNYNGTVGNDGVGTTPFVIDDLNADSQPSTDIVTLEQAISLSSINFDFVSDQTDTRPFLSFTITAVSVTIAVLVVGGVLVCFKKRKSHISIVKKV